MGEVEVLWRRGFCRRRATSGFSKSEEELQSPVPSRTWKLKDLRLTENLLNFTSVSTTRNDHFAQVIA